MMSTQTNTLRLSQSRRVRRNRELNRYRATTTTMGPISTTLTIGIILSVLALLYLTQITKTSIYGYQVSTLGAQQEELVQQQQELAVEAARLKSLERIRSESVAKNMVSEDEVSYLTLESNRQSAVEEQSLNQ